MGDLWVLPDRRAAGAADQRCGGGDRPGVVARQLADRVRERSRRPHGSLGPRSARQPRRAADRGARRRLGPGVVARRQPHRLPRRSPARWPVVDLQRDDAPLRLRRRPRTASWAGRPGRPTATRSRSARCSRTRIATARGSTRSCCTPSNTSGAVLVAARRRALGRQPTGHRAGVVARRLPDGVRQRRHAVGRAGGRTRRRHRPAAGGRHRSAGVAELGGRLEAHRLPDAARAAPHHRRRQPARSDSRSISPGATARRPSASSSTPVTSSTACSRRCAARRTS